MKLYTHPGASSLSVHILLREIGKPFELEVIDVRTKIRPDGSDYRTIAPRGMVPFLELPGGETLTENVVIAQYICDIARRHDLMPPHHEMARYRVMEWQSFIAAELHKSFSPLYWPTLDDAMRQLAVKRIESRLAFAERSLFGPYLTGEIFTAADAYMFVIASWTTYFGIPRAPYPRLSELLCRVGDRPSVRSALDAEGQGFVTLDDVVPLP